jgi:hypothetical protein
LEEIAMYSDSDMLKDVVAELKDVERAVRNTPGITQVENHLTVDPTIYTPV